MPFYEAGDGFVTAPKIPVNNNSYSYKDSYREERNNF